MAATSAAGEAVARRIGDYADAQAKATGDPAWAEGGAARAEMQAAGAALVGGLGGGIASAAGSAAGAGLASISAGKLNALSDSIANSSPTGNADMDRTLGNIVANVIATGAGGVVGGNAGAIAGYNDDRFNRQLHPDEKKIIHDLANGDADKEHRLEAAGCVLVHCAAEYASGTADYAKYSMMEQEGAGYAAEQAQLKNYNGTTFSAAGYGGMVRQTPGSSLFHYSVDDAQNDQKSWASGMATQRPGSIDYVTIQAGAGIGGSIIVNLHDGSVYAGGSVSASREKGAGIVVGMIPDNVGRSAADRADLTNQFLGGYSVGGNGCLYGICGGLNHAVGGQTAIEVGVGVGGVTKTPSPDGNAGGGYSLHIFTIPGMGVENSKH